MGARGFDLFDSSCGVMSWHESDMQLALDEVLRGKESVRKNAASYGIAEGAI